MISTLIALPYQMARLPLVVIDNTLSERLPDDSATRLTLDWAIGSADRIAGTLLGNHDIAKRGADRLERFEKLTKAAELEQQATAARQKAQKTAAAGQREAAQKRKAAQELASSGLADADAAEARAKKAAKAQATKKAAAKKTAANKRAAERTATIKDRQASADSATEAKKKSAQRAAKTEIDKARETKQAAAVARADAERLDTLVDAKKQERKQD